MIKSLAQLSESLIGAMSVAKGANLQVLVVLLIENTGTREIAGDQ